MPKKGLEWINYAIFYHSIYVIYFTLWNKLYSRQNMLYTPARVCPLIFTPRIQSRIK